MVYSLGIHGPTILLRKSLSRLRELRELEEVIDKESHARACMLGWGLCRAYHAELYFLNWDNH